ncbi:MAG: Crp/Fnr family transcriptional regulator [Pseudomonadota bacterium]
MSTVDQLASIPLLRMLDDPNLASLAEVATTRHFRKKTIVLSQDDETDAVYFVIEGKVRVFRDSDSGNEVTLNILDVGEYFGEMALISKGLRVASVETLEDTVLVCVARSVFMQHVEDSAQIAWQMCADIIEKMRSATLNASSFALLDVRGRVLRTLEINAVDENGKSVVEGITHQDIANLVGASRETVSRTLKELREAGEIETAGRSIIVKSGH